MLCDAVCAQRESFDVIGRVGFDHDFGVSRYVRHIMLKACMRTAEAALGVAL